MLARSGLLLPRKHLFSNFNLTNFGKKQAPGQKGCQHLPCSIINKLAECRSLSSVHLLHTVGKELSPSEPDASAVCRPPGQGAGTADRGLTPSLGKRSVAFCSVLLSRATWISHSHFPRRNRKAAQARPLFPQDNHMLAF